MVSDKTTSTEVSPSEMLENVNLDDLADAVVLYRERRRAGYPFDLWFDGGGQAYTARRKTGLVHIEDVVDINSLDVNLPQPHLNDEEYDAQRAVVVEWPRDQLETLCEQTDDQREVATDGGADVYRRTRPLGAVECSL